MSPQRGSCCGRHWRCSDSETAAAACCVKITCSPIAGKLIRRKTFSNAANTAYSAAFILLAATTCTAYMKTPLVVVATTIQPL